MKQRLKVGDLVRYNAGHAWINLTKQAIVHVGVYIGIENSMWNEEYVDHVVLVGDRLRRFPVRRSGCDDVKVLRSYAPDTSEKLLEKQGLDNERE